MDDVQSLMNEWLLDDSKSILELDQIQYARPPGWPDIIDPSFISTFVSFLSSIQWDNEVSHMYEDELHEGVLAAIADNRCIDPQSCARIALTSHYIPFKRYYSREA